MTDPFKTEKQKMLAGELYLSFDDELVAERRRATQFMRLYNNTTEDELDKRTTLITELFGRVGSNIFITPPFYCDYGNNIYAGDNVYMNFGCVILDCNEVHLGNNLLMAPNVQLYTAYHPIDPTIRVSGKELAAPIYIGDQVWIGGGAIVCPGVTIGDNTVIGAGSVVTKDIPANVVAVGNPCQVLRAID
ncbi:MAG: sugar O-acetyltransferase [Oculatellaceae cyanobacterium bins.114]|nr:sugar O-acetyltransferase [Oculatellaceae cyanobacterium bins.114]